MNKSNIGSSVLAAWVVLTLGVAGQVGAQPKTPPAPVRVALAEMRAIAPTIWVAGTVVSRDKARISAEVDGRVVSIAEVGELIEKGEVLAVIDNTRLKLLQREAQSKVESLATQIGFLNKELGRSTRLARSKLTSETAVDRLQSDFQVAVAEHDAAQARLALIDDSLARTRIQAPFRGYVTERLKMAGESVAVDTPVLQLIGLENLEIEASAPLRYVPYVHKGMPLESKGFGDRGTAVVRSLVSIGANDSRQFVMRLDFNTTKWLPGTPVQIAIPTEEQVERLVVPRDALVLRRDGVYLFRIGNDNTAMRVEVEPGVGVGALIAVTGEIDPGERVVVRGGERLRSGQQVKLLNAEEPAS